MEVGRHLIQSDLRLPSSLRMARCLDQRVVRKIQNSVILMAEYYFRLKKSTP